MHPNTLRGSRPWTVYEAFIVYYYPEEQETEQAFITHTRQKLTQNDKIEVLAKRKIKKKLQPGISQNMSAIYLNKNLEQQP